MDARGTVHTVALVFVASMLLWVIILHPYLIASANHMTLQVVFPDRLLEEAIFA